MTDNVIDIRPDTFLRELSEGTDILEASAKAGIDPDELRQMIEDNPKFAKTVREVVIDRAEGVLRKGVSELIETIYTTAEESIKLIQYQTEEAVAAIHDFSSKDDG